MSKSLKDKAIEIKGKKYVLVSDRIVYFNQEYPQGFIQTKLLSNPESEHVVVKAKVTPDIAKLDRYFTGLSQAVIGQGMVNTTAALENAETSAVGRALAMMGIGVIDSVASVDEINKATYTPNTKTQAVKTTTATPDIMEGHKCKKCGGEMVLNPKTGNWFCKNKCWLKGK